MCLRFEVLEYDGKEKELYALILKFLHFTWLVSMEPTQNDGWNANALEKTWYRLSTTQMSRCWCNRAKSSPMRTCSKIGLCSSELNTEYADNRRCAGNKPLNGWSWCIRLASVLLMRTAMQRLLARVLRYAANAMFTNTWQELTSAWGELSSPGTEPPEMPSQPLGRSGAMTTVRLIYIESCRIARLVADKIPPHARNQQQGRG